MTPYNAGSSMGAQGSRSRSRRMTMRMTVAIAAGALVLGVTLWGAWRLHRRTAATAGATIPTTMPATGVGGNMPGMQMPGTPPVGGDGASVSLTPAQIREFGITFATAEVRSMIAETRATGVVLVNETRVVQMTPKVNGFAERLYVDYTGQAVRRGAPLLELYAPDLVAAEQELLLAERLQREMGHGAVPGTSQAPTELVDAARRRLQLWDVSDAQIDEILRTGRVRRTLTLTAPASGVVLQKAVVQGQGVAAGMPLYTIADLSDVWVETTLRDVDAASVRVGSTAELQLASQPGRRFAGRITYIYPTVDSVTRTTRARMTVANPDGTLRPGMYATVRLSTPVRRALTVPSSAILQTGARAVVFVDVGHGALQPRTVETGRTAGELTEILSGIEPGARVVTSAQFLLDSESNLGDVIRAMLSQTGTSDMGGMGNTSTPGTSMPGMSMPEQP